MKRLLIKEAVYNKNLTSAEGRAQEAMSIKEKYEKIWANIEGMPTTSTSYKRNNIRITPLLNSMYKYGFIPTSTEEGWIRSYGLYVKGDILKYILYAIVVLGIIVLITPVLDVLFPWFMAFAFIFWCFSR